MDVVQPNDTDVLVVTRNGFGKRTPIHEISRQGRYGLGVSMLARRKERTGPVVAMHCINDKDDILLMTLNGIVLRTSLEQIRQTKRRGAQTVTLIDLADDDIVVAVAIMDSSASESLAADDGSENGFEDETISLNSVENNGASADIADDNDSDDENDDDNGEDLSEE
jgi:DNA gyrase subunit A